MATWLGRRIHDAERDADNEERARRLESDAEAVQVITIHRSKGLEFPIVYCPFAWDGHPFKSEVPVFHDPANANVRTIDVGHEGNAFAQHQRFELEEGRGEDLRLLYVALTRARHQAVLWWASVKDSQHSPLARLLFDRDEAGVVPPYGAAPLPRSGRRRGRPRPRRTCRGRAGRPGRRRAMAVRRGRPARARGGGVRTPARHGVAARVVLEPHERRARDAEHRERAGAHADVRRGRAGARAPGCARRSSRRRPDAADRARLGRHAGGCPRRHRPPRGLRTHRLRR